MLKASPEVLPCLRLQSNTVASGMPEMTSDATLLMLTVLSAKMTGVGGEAGVIFELDSPEEIKRVLTAGGWTVLTGVNLMLFSLLHNPCSTTIYTIYKETRSARWAALATLLPLFIGFAVTALVAFLWRALS